MFFIGNFFYSHFSVSSFSIVAFSSLAIRPPSLRPYQLECIEKSLEALSQGITRQAISLPVGSGKTVILSNLIPRIPHPSSFPRATKVLILIHREELIQQISKQISFYNPDLKITIERGILKADHSSDVIIASVPTLGRVDSPRLNNYNPELFKAIIIDEAHHGVAESYMRIINHFIKIEKGIQTLLDSTSKKDLLPIQSQNLQSIENNANNAKNKNSQEMLVWGCSATFSRNDHLALGSLFQKVIYHLDFQTMIEGGFLSPTKYFQIFTEMDLTGVNQFNQDYDPYSLSLAINTPKRNKLIVQVWKRLSEEHARKATIVFGLNIKHVEDLKEAFRSIGIDAHSITSQTDESERREILNQYSLGKIPVIINCAVLTEGTDLPITDCILLTKPTCNSNLYIQMIGRGLRIHPEKKYCLILDVIDKDRASNRSLISFPNLMSKKSGGKKGEEEEKDLENDLKRKEDLENEEMQKNNRESIKEFKEKGRVIKIKESKMDYLNIGGRLAWIGGDPQHYLLSSRNSGNYILTITQMNPLLARIEEIVISTDQKNQKKDSSSSSNETFNSNSDSISNSNSTNSQKYRKRNSNFTINSIIDPPVPIMNAIERFEEYLLNLNTLNDFSAYAGWRRKYPPSVGQIQILNSMALKLNTILTMGKGGIGGGSIGGDSIGIRNGNISGWTMGKASNVISKFLLMKLIKGKKIPFDNWEDLISNC